ncbi:hypothetical protein BU26DRAFT_516703 [Trematosphaeria pertusa]|uniref:Uncharacterized protein n=1 Tax=Trematosphaeria pertusa TaxID=390896 RepID=A0A6A6IPJ4_9PLEO|nr:uncharacterized protein BU26DRAFT_516703 [Trematosphaeria pertusa]KAF2251988.1 hypothetical protein BU26DRAFT_516703 [Trematosphaeria pertusa]
MASSNHSAPDVTTGANGNVASVHGNGVDINGEDTNEVIGAQGSSEAQPSSSAQNTAAGQQVNGAQHPLVPEPSRCPYHAPILELRPPRSPTENMSPMERYIHTPSNELPIALSGDGSVGSSVSAGCTCGQTTSGTRNVSSTDCNQRG